MDAKIKVNIVSNQLTEVVKEQMWQLYKKYYHYSRVSFMERIEKNNYYSFYTQNDQIIGFTGLRINHAKVYGRKQFLIYFGQTVVHEDYRGKSLIPTTGAKLCMKFWKAFLFSDVYCWADSLTYKAYLVFAKTVAEMYPTYKQKMPAKIKTIIDHIGELHYGDDFCPSTGTIRKDRVLVNDTTMQIPAKYTFDRDIQYFLQVNPKYKKGHGILTICPLDRKNVFMLLKRYMNKVVGGISKKKTSKPVEAYVF